MGKWVLIFVIMMLGEERAIDSIKIDGFSTQKECLAAGEQVKKDITPTKDLQKFSWEFNGNVKFSCIKVE
ncbi:MAG: hypothetical protein HOB18_08575 [Nitrospina sp.]|jgi:hypothetical protein|nr:hypothetical protein [Nitrospina sp.]